ncbi:hypothetical protein [Amphritea japonica]|uniref:Uncharacterized protein n=1 Tax=Amphritea japonica ATCC BAA-1530 TaxID=1278309 RepID=A0A7R6SSS6_9GAMM|nr:hypothetical protein [Amphritea japonica]BBB25935.1 hypothetical protein AMJAP_1340 [Amphritea japonica ATCC BAA-1530]
MKCDVCGRSITINWGNEFAVVCEEHTNHITKLTDLKRSAAKVWTEGTVKFIPVEVDTSGSNLLSVWWAITWRFMLMLVVIGGFLGLIFYHSMNTLIEQEMLTTGVAETIGVIFYLVIATAFIFVALDRVIGKKIGNVRLVIVSAKESDIEEK